MRSDWILAVLIVSFLWPALLQGQAQPQTKRVDQLTGPEILQCIRENTCDGFNWEIARVLRSRFTVRQLISMYPHQSASVRHLIPFVLYHDHGRAVAKLMRRAALQGLKPGQTTEDNNYVPLQWLAKRCDPTALSELNRPANYRNSYPVACMQWQYTLLAFGRCGYTPVIPLLAASLEDACLNNVIAAQDSLRRLLPQSTCPKLAGKGGNFSLEAECYRRAAHPSGYR